MSPNLKNQNSTRVASLLRHNRIDRTIAGLTKRVETCASAISAIQQTADNDRNQLKQEMQREDTKLRQKFATDYATEITNDDELINETWTKFDSKILTSVHDERKKIANFRKVAAADLLNNKQTSEKQLADLVANAKADKARLLSTLESSKELLSRFARESNAIAQQCNELVERHGLKVASVKSDQTLELLSTGENTFTSIKSEIALDLELANKALASLRNYGLARFSGSWMLWAIAAVLAGIVAWIVWSIRLGPSNIASFLVSFAAFGIALIVSGVAMLIAARPMLRKHLKQNAPRVYQYCDSTSQRIARGAHHLQTGYDSRLQVINEKLQRDLDETTALAAANSERIKSELKTNEKNVLVSLAESRVKATTNFESRLGEIQTNEKSSLSILERNGQQEIDALRSIEAKRHRQIKSDETKKTAYTRWRIRQAIDRTNRRLDLLRNQVAELCPVWDAENLAGGKNYLGYLPIGTLRVDVGQSHEATLINSQTHPLSENLPLIFQLVEHGNLIVKSDSQNQPQAQRLVRNLILRAFATLPAGSLQVTIIDPDGLGREFSHLMQLADTDPTMVNYRVWTQPTHLSEQLAKLSHHTEDVIQQLLRDRYKDIRQYNAEAGSMAEPFRIVLWSRFPAGVDEASWRYLSSLLSSGGRCGVSTIVMVDTDFPVPPMVDIRRLQNTGLTINIQTDSNTGNSRAFVESNVLSKFPLALDEPPDLATQQRILSHCAAQALKANRVEVPFDGLVPREQNRYQSSSASGLSIPIGHAGVGRNQTLRLGHGTAQHVLVAGKTGSGKSSFLHTLVTSAAIHYGPDQLRLVLLDFKKGVEFQVYSETQTPHADIIGIESQREFGVSTLEYLDRVMQQRGEAFRGAGVQDIPSWCQARPNQPMPRVLVVVDEFQEIFTDDDKLGQQAAMLLDRIVRQGRSFGIHVVLASQTLGGAYSLPRTTLAQMAVRVALQCEGADAMMILSEDNLAAERLRYAGQAIYNEQSGRIEGNQPFQVAYLSKEHQRDLLNELTPSPVSRRELSSGLEKCVVFDGHRKAAWDKEAADTTLEVLIEKNPSCPSILLGDSVSIEPVVAISLFRQAGQNMLLVGTDDENGASVLQSVIASFFGPSNTTSQSHRTVTLVDASREEDKATQSMMNNDLTGDARVSRFNAANVDSAIQAVHSRMQERLVALDGDSEDKSIAPEATSNVDELLVVTHLQRLRSLRKNDEFSFGDDGDQPKIDKLLQAILREGPSVGIHTLVWCDTANTFNRWLPRQSMHDLEYRALMQMSVNDSNQLIDSAAANKLDKNVMLLHEESSGQARKFRPYALELIAKSV